MHIPRWLRLIRPEKAIAQQEREAARLHREQEEARRSLEQAQQMLEQARKMLRETCAEGEHTSEQAAEVRAALRRNQIGRKLEIIVGTGKP